MLNPLPKNDTPVKKVSQIDQTEWDQKMKSVTNDLAKKKIGANRKLYETTRSEKSGETFFIEATMKVTLYYQ